MFITHFFDLLSTVDDYLWSYAGIPAILVLGVLLSVRGRFFQIFQLPKIWRIFFGFFKKEELDPNYKEPTRGVTPLQAFFASIGGCIGIGNIVVVCSAVQIGGPGAIFWMWIASFLGMIVKYSEIYLGITYRIPNNLGTYNGGPMYFVQQVTSKKWVPQLICLLLCVYGADMYLFRIMTRSIVTSWHINQYAVIAFLLIAILIAGKKGLGWAGKASSIIIPAFLVAYIGISAVVFFNNAAQIPGLFRLIITSAFTGHAALGAFTGAGMLLAMSQGMKRACYAGDIGIGYASVIHAETEETNPAKQAALGVFGIFIDTFIVCTTSVMLILVTGLWNQGIHEERAVAMALGKYIPHVDWIWPIFIFLLGYSTIIAIFSVGKRAAQILSPKYGERAYFIYATCAFLLFSFIGSEIQIMTIMSLTGVCLLLINISTIFLLRKRVSFKIPSA